MKKILIKVKKYISNIIKKINNKENKIEIEQLEEWLEKIYYNFELFEKGDKIYCRLFNEECDTKTNIKKLIKKTLKPHLKKANVSKKTKIKFMEEYIDYIFENATRIATEDYFEWELELILKYRNRINSFEDMKRIFKKYVIKEMLEINAVEDTIFLALPIKWDRYDNN